jgi:hypothetical protein
VRTGTRAEGSADASAAADSATPAGEARSEAPVSATQSIPTGQNRAVQSGRSATAAAAPATGTSRAATGTSRAAATGTAAAGTQGVQGAPAAKGAKATAPVKGAPAKATGGRRTAAKAGRGPRRARLQLRHIDTWSAFKITFVLSVALFFIWMVAVGVLYGVLGGLGVFETLNELFGQLSASEGGDVITPGVVFGAAAVIGAVNIILLTALGTVTAFIYNLCSDLVGGLEVTLSERD